MVSGIWGEEVLGKGTIVKKDFELVESLGTSV